ncbi:MAG: hypothetical protein ABSG62_17600 [Terracidiphilus sp.]|jgi:hypothetical protein
MMRAIQKRIAFRLKGHKSTMNSIFMADSEPDLPWYKVKDLLEICKVNVRSYPGNGTCLRQDGLRTEFQTPDDKVLAPTKRAIRDFLGEAGAKPASIDSYLKKVWQSLSPDGSGPTQNVERS